MVMDKLKKYLLLSTTDEKKIFDGYIYEDLKYRTQHTFEDYLDDNYFICEECDMLIHNDDKADNSYENFGIDCLCKDCNETMLLDKR